ncbi:MAG: C13 family peptidase [Azoarcus sp.]|jgi:hypothetical protein|nr:C13 family peptidase [Azoarcus sp.]
MSVSNTVSRSRLLSDFCQLGRVLTLRRPKPDSFSPDIGKLPWIVLLYCLISITLSIGLNGLNDGALVNGEGFVSVVFVPFGAIAVIAGLLKWIDGRLDGGSIWLAFTLLLPMMPLAEFIGATVWSTLSKTTFFDPTHSTFPGFTSWPGLSFFVFMLPHLWLALAGSLFVAYSAYGGGWRRILCALLAPPGLVFAFTSADPLSLWQISTVTPATTDRPALTIDEEMFYGQPRLLDENLARIEAGKPGIPEIFFLGVAGHEEGVFMREVIAVEQLFRDRYNTVGHSMILVNNSATARKIPLASYESLSRALHRIGKQMNGKEDLLFLFLSSHGLADHHLSIQLPPFGFSDITPQMLRKALDDAGIEHRVVVVSACYSGGFVPALASDNTLVITAASADRNSFGCNDTNDLTDFGRAYFDEALRKTRSFTEAFEHAKAIIAARETADGSTPSNPQISGGESLSTQLEWFAREAGSK